MSPAWQGSGHWAGTPCNNHSSAWHTESANGPCLHQFPPPEYLSRFANKSDKKFCGELCVTPAGELCEQSSKPNQLIFTPLFQHALVTRITSVGYTTNYSGLLPCLSLTMWHWHIKITEWFHWVQPGWSPLRTHAFSLQQSGTPRAGGHTLTITFHRHWNTSSAIEVSGSFWNLCVFSVFMPSRSNTFYKSTVLKKDFLSLLSNKLFFWMRFLDPVRNSKVY